jgi:RNA polymerase sigma-B factor
MARRYRGRGESADDLEQVARLGLIKAIDRYDPARGSFTAYAVMTISGELKRHFRDKTWGVHVPRRVQELSLEVRHASTVLTGRLSRTPTPAEIAAHLKIEESLVRDALGSVAGYYLASLNAPVSGAEDGSELGEMFGDLDADLEGVNDRITVSRLLKLLPARERRILALRFYGNRTQAEIAAELGISQMHVSRLLSRALTWLRAAMLNDEPPRWAGDDAPDRCAAHAVLSHRPGGTLVEIRGEIDRDAAESVRLTLHRAIAAATGSVCVDLSGVPSVDAAAVAVLVDAASTAALAQVRLRLAGAQPLVAYVLQVCGVGHLVDSPDGRLAPVPKGIHCED